MTYSPTAPIIRPKLAQANRVATSPFALAYIGEAWAGYTPRIPGDRARPTRDVTRTRLQSINALNASGLR